MRCHWILRPYLVVAFGLLTWSVGPATAQQPAGRETPGRAAEQQDMELVGSNDLYLADWANTGLHIVQLTGSARAIIAR